MRVTASFASRSVALVLVAGALVAFAARVAWAAAENPAVVFVEQIKAKELFETLSYPARVIPRFNTTLLAEADGVVSRIHAPLGQRVAARQKLLSITHTDPIYQYAPIVMLAPVAGVVSSIDVTEGSQVTKGQKLGSVTDPAQVRVSVEVPAQDLPLLSRGMTGELSLSGQERKVALKVRGISPFVDPATGTASCELERVAGDSSVLAPGMLGQVTFKAGVHRGVSIPDYAVIYRGADTFVRVIDADQKALQLPVKLGRKERGNVEVLDGLKADSRLVLRASRYVAEGEKVKVDSK